MCDVNVELNLKHMTDMKYLVSDDFCQGKVSIHGCSTILRFSICYSPQCSNLQCVVMLPCRGSSEGNKCVWAKSSEFGILSSDVRVGPNPKRHI